MKSTDDLLRELAQAESIEGFIQENRSQLRDISLADYLQQLLTEKQTTKAEVIRRAELNEIYCYQIFSGLKSPSRDKVICLAFGFQLNAQETQQLLKSCGLPFLYAKHRRDAVILFALHKALTVPQTNEMLYDLGLETLG